MRSVTRLVLALAPLVACNTSSEGTSPPLHVDTGTGGSSQSAGQGAAAGMGRAGFTATGGAAGTTGVSCSLDGCSVGGKGGTAGTASAGSGGTAGKATAGSGGSAGKAGSGGISGAGGAAGGAGGVGGGSAGVGGAGGSSGTAGAGGVAGASGGAGGGGASGAGGGGTGGGGAAGVGGGGAGGMGGASGGQAGFAGCDPVGPFDMVMPVPNVNGTLDDMGARLSHDQLTMYLQSNRNGASYQLFTTTRATTSSPWGVPVMNAATISFTGDEKPTVSPDELTLIMDAATGVSGQTHLWKFSRASTSSPWGAPQAIAATAGMPNENERDPFLDDGGSSLYFTSDRLTGSLDIFLSPRMADGSFGAPSEVVGVNDGQSTEGNPTVSEDGRTMFFFSNRQAQGSNGNDVFVATRPVPSGAFSTPTPVDELNTSKNDEPSYLTPDHCALYYARSSEAAGELRMRQWQAIRGKTYTVGSQRIVTAANNQLGRGVATDASGNVAWLGVFQGTIDLGGGPISTAGGDECFIAKYDAGGKVSWAKHFGAGAGWGCYSDGNGVAFDGAGNVLITGKFSGTMPIGTPPPISATFDGTSNLDGFVIKLSSAGNVLWGKAFGGKGEDAGTGIVADSTGNVIVTGYVSSVNATIGAIGLPSAAEGTYDVAVAKLTPSGAPTWGWTIGGALEDRGYGVAVDSADDVYVAASFRDTLWMPGADVPDNAVGGSDALVFRVSSSGSFASSWYKVFGSTGDDAATAIVKLPSGDLALTGYYSGVGVQPDPMIPALPWGGGYDPFLMRLGASTGVLLLSEGFANGGDQQPLAIATDALGNVAISGWMSQPGRLGGLTLPTFGGQDMFLARYDGKLDQTWSRTFGGPNTEIGYGVAFGANGRLFQSGFVEGAVDFGAGLAPYLTGYEATLVGFDMLPQYK